MVKNGANSDLTAHTAYYKAYATCHITQKKYKLWLQAIYIALA
jgi:hypothetical protein